MSSDRSTGASPLNYLILLGVGLIWGSQFILNKIALDGFSAETISAARVVIGVLTLSLILAFGFEKASSTRDDSRLFRIDFLGIGLLEATIPFFLVAWAQQHLSSSVTAVLMGTIPLFVMLLEALFLGGKSLPWKRLLGVSLGFCGIIVLVAPGLSATPAPGTAGGFFLLIPSLAVLASALSFAAAIILIRVRISADLGPTRSARGILLGATLTTLPLALFSAKSGLKPPFHPPFSSILALALLGVFCGGVVYTLFVVLINRAGPSFASMSNYIVPIVGALIGIVFSGEKVTPTLIGSLLLILLSLWLSGDGKKSTATPSNFGSPAKGSMTEPEDEPPRSL